VKKKGSRRDLMVDELEKELLYTKQQLTTPSSRWKLRWRNLIHERRTAEHERGASEYERGIAYHKGGDAILNEELMTINMQYQSKGEELTN